MSDYINREEAIEKLKKIMSFKDAVYLDGIISILESVPTAHVREDVQGEWKYDEFGCYCTACNEYAVEVDEEPRKTSYCPECGARMVK